ncbi:MULTISPECIES: CHRD domain-containing protein [Rhodopseudomonas]|uniref:CHRD domain-containing protein n=2 Tax=Nitrobacteraceae TaxID=41294 RepID=A0A0D7E6W5_RHOPL|nr:MULTISPECIES: CHRD domain-containing protein [Rhodopseudomonas]KIZ36603.1 CHRD domain-containing protein [Rhodopseudomonas palustris]MDF3812788.1 CHRD domain-containing protein [Rhodopseudomonas sp. BAL398]WOK20692.1 CHRD domain-containing protein [Rhodopseudomonas sp. BAL398]
MIASAIALGAIAISVGAITTGPAFAEEMTMTTPLTSAAEVPPNNSTGKGTAKVDYDTASKKLSWTITYSGLTGPATAAHFHGPAEPGKNAGVVIPIPNIAKSPAEGSATLTDAQAADLMAGKYYVNIHTAANKGGEIRGQVTK